MVHRSNDDSVTDHNALQSIVFKRTRRAQMIVRQARDLEVRVSNPGPYSCGLSGYLLSWYQEIQQKKYGSSALLQSFHHFPYNENPTRALNTTSLKCGLPAINAIDRRKKIYTCIWRFKDTSCKRASFRKRNKVGYFSNRKLSETKTR